MARKLTGFLPYGQSDDDVIVRDPMTGAPATGMTLTGTRTVDPVKGSRFDNGGDGLAGLAIDWAGLGETASEVIRGCSWSVEVESGWLVQTGVNEALFSARQNSTTRIVGPRVSDGVNYIDWLIRAGKFTSRFQLHPESYQDRDYVTVYCSYNFGGSLHTYFDGNLASVTEFAAGSDDNILPTLFDNFHVGSESINSGSAPVSHFMRNFQFVGRPLTLPTHQRFRNVHAYGDSFFDQGGYPHSSWPILNLKPDYPDLSGAGPSNETISTPTFLDLAALPSIQRTLAEAGVQVGRHWQEQTSQSVALLDVARPLIHNYAIGGSGIDDSQLTFTFAQQIDRALDRGDVPDVALVHHGQNDISNTPVVLDAVWRAKYEAQLDRLLARNPDCKFVICTMTSLRSDPAFQSSQFDQRTADCNGLIAEIAQSRAEVELCDLFTIFGGHDFDPALFKEDDRHPDVLGSRLLGQSVAAAAMRFA